MRQVWICMLSVSVDDDVANNKSGASIDNVRFKQGRRSITDVWDQPPVSGIRRDPRGKTDF